MKSNIVKSFPLLVACFVSSGLVAQTLSLVSEDTSAVEVTVSGDLVVNGNSDAVSPSLEVGGDVAFDGGVSFEEKNYFDDGETRLENFLSFDQSRLLLTAKRFEWDDRWRNEGEVNYRFDVNGLTISTQYADVVISPGAWGGSVRVNGEALATQNAVDSIFSGSGSYSFKFARSSDYNDGGGVATGQNAVSFGAGIAAGNSSWAIGTNKGNSDDGYLGPYSEGKNAHAYGEVSRALGDYSFAFGSGTFSGEAQDIDPSNSSEAGYYPTDALGNYSFAFGEKVKAAGEKSFAFGGDSEAYGGWSLAFGAQAKAYGDYSVVFGRKNTAGSRSLTVLGEGAYGTSGDDQNWVSTDPLFVIGNDDSNDDKSSAMRVFKNGHTIIGSHDQPTPGNGAQVLEVLGAVQIGNTSVNVAGSIRWTGSDFEGFDGLEWKSLTVSESSPSGPQGDIGMGLFTAN